LLFDSDFLNNSIITAQNSVTCWFLSNNNVSVIAVGLHCIIHVTGWYLTVATRTRGAARWNLPWRVSDHWRRWKHSVSVQSYRRNSIANRQLETVLSLFIH